MEFVVGVSLLKCYCVNFFAATTLKRVLNFVGNLILTVVCCLFNCRLFLGLGEVVALKAMGKVSVIVSVYVGGTG